MAAFGDSCMVMNPAPRVFNIDVDVEFMGASQFYSSSSFFLGIRAQH